MKAFDLDRHLIGAWERFSRSFSHIRSEDLRATTDQQYDAGRFWPEALLSLNPRYRPGPGVDDLVADGMLDPATGQVFRLDGTPLRLHRHQAAAILRARSGDSCVVTTGTGSGKSLCFFIPVVDSILRSRRAGQPRTTRAIIVYPMNALANSQMKEIEKFIGQSGLADDLKPVVRRYTGQESQEERQDIAHRPPDILLTNYMMVELLLTRQDELDTRVIANAASLAFIVLDELHTYRGRQGADVAVLVRRLRARCTPDKAPVCIGTSATMATEGTREEQAVAVAGMATRLFGVPIDADGIIGESLQRATDSSITLAAATAALPALLRQPVPPLPDRQAPDRQAPDRPVLDNRTLRRHPLAVWTELALGLDDGLEPGRKKPVPFGAAVERLARDSGVETETCRQQLETFLTLASLPERQRGGAGEEAFLAFKLHRFISGVGEIFTTLAAPPRTVLFDGQLEDPDTPGHRLYPTRFCRACGHEYHIVTRGDDNGQTLFRPRGIDDTPPDPGKDGEVAGQDGEVAGYLCPVPADAPDFAFDGSLGTCPESWLEERNGRPRLRSYRKWRVPVPCHVTPEGRLTPEGRPGAAGRAFWFIPGKFAFCLYCRDEPNYGMRERSKLAGLSGEGRSSATTLLVSSALEWMNRPANDVPETNRKLLVFTDNRQDAALQSGHFNDFLFVSLLRGAILRAVLEAGTAGLGDDDFGPKVAAALGFTAGNAAARVHWMLTPTAGRLIREDAGRALARVLAHRVWTELERGWRYTNPGLVVLKLLDIRFADLAEMAADDAPLAAIWPGTPTAAARAGFLKTVLGAMLEGLAVETESLDPAALDSVAQKSRGLLRPPWTIDAKENPRGRTALVLHAPGRKSVRLREEKTLLRAGYQSRIARLVKKNSLPGIGRDAYVTFFGQLLDLLATAGLVRPVDLAADRRGWRLTAAAVRLVPGPALTDPEQRGNPFFHDLYTAIVADLTSGHSAYQGLEGREHTAQVSPDQREWREWRFRYEADDRKKLQQAAPRPGAGGESGQFLPALFCSPTMELGVDISALDAVCLRNAPPTPANYAQRAGRPGRAGQAAVIVTYCAASSPHDQYFFKRRGDMVAGVVRPPALDMTNEELVRSHLHAVWLAAARLALAPDIPNILDLKAEGCPLRAEIRATIDAADLVSRAVAPMQQVLDHILAADAGAPPAWMGDDPAAFVRQVAGNAPRAFDQAFTRWRELYHAARTQLAEAHRHLSSPGLSSGDRNKNKAAHSQANDQISLLEQGKAAHGSDFYAYRYLATEGFLPGYNFPRLPLYAFIPGEGKSGSFLSRARFLAIAEFGPRSLVYHEGRAYRVVKAKLPPGVQTGDELATGDIHICAACGASHDGEVERCHGCDAAMAGAAPVRRTLRIDNVEATPIERITANDEERVRQGFDIQTVFAWPRKGGQTRVTRAEFRCGDRVLLVLQYANSADISRLNKGLRRRKDRTVAGFSIDPRTGYWAKSADETTDNDRPADIVRPVRVVPIVRDRKNALLLRFTQTEKLDARTVATVHHALLRGIGVVYQLEEGEILGEPLPDRDNRLAILVYEAAEGGAGVLARLIDEPAAMGTVARTALDLMHCDNIDAAVAAGDAGLLTEKADDSDKSCVRGCYRCLLSYFNQPDHEQIDRRGGAARQWLVDLARGHTVRDKTGRAKTVRAKTAAPGAITGNTPGDASGDTLSPWPGAFAAAGLPPVDREAIRFAGRAVVFAWRTHCVAAARPVLPDMAAAAARRGWELVPLPASVAEGVPAALLDLLRGPA